MEPHPIPQNVSAFQFRLVGDMTLRQFAYLAGGSVIAYLFFVFLAAPYPILAWPLIIVSTILGVAFAFLPVGSRPLDYWVGAFLKAVYSPTKRVWQKNKTTYKEDPLFRSRYITYLSGATAQIPLQPTPLPPPPQQSTAPTPAPIVKPATDLPTSEELQKTVDLARQAQNLQMKIIQTERTISQIKSEAQKSMPVPIDYTQQVNQIISNLQILVGEASSIKQQLEAVTGPEEKTAPIIPPKVVKVAIPIKPKPQQIALTTFPNVINGILKDTTGNYLEGVIAVIHDKEGLPVRALKTNKLGQFTGSTPLPNGVYTLELEKEGLNFDVLQIELSGAILPPLIITAKQTS